MKKGRLRSNASNECRLNVHCSFIPFIPFGHPKIRNSSFLMIELSGHTLDDRAIHKPRTNGTEPSSPPPLWTPRHRCQPLRSSPEPRADTFKHFERTSSEHAMFVHPVRPPGKGDHCLLWADTSHTLREVTTQVIT